MRKKQLVVKLALVALCALLSGCGGQNARDILGLGRKAPDEFRVVSRPPLSTPPDFQLRPPVEGQGENVGLPPADLQAKSLIVEGKDISDIEYDFRRKMGVADTAVGVVDVYAGGSAADQSLLKSAGASVADPNIREIIYQERSTIEEAAKSSWLAPKKTGGVIVDAEKEKQRLDANKEAGKSVIEGETPSIEPKERGFLEKLF